MRFILLAAPVCVLLALGLEAAAQTVSAPTTVAVTCKVTAEGAMSECALPSPLPEGVGLISAYAALNKVKARRLDAASLTANPAGSTIRVDAPLPGTSGTPQWESQPSRAQLEAAYPARAKRLKQSGNVLLNCTATENGALTGCQIRSETPNDMGFGRAAMSLVPAFKLKAQTSAGVPVAGQPVAVPVAFRMS